MRWNLAWYVPVGAYFILRVFWQNVEFAWEGVRATIRHFSFLLLISPAFDLWGSALIALLLVPWYCLILLPGFFDSATNAYKHRYMWTILLIGATFMGCALLIELANYSWPFLVDPEHRERIRMIPFLGCAGCENIQ